MTIFYGYKYDFMYVYVILPFQVFLLVYACTYEFYMHNHDLIIISMHANMHFGLHLYAYVSFACIHMI